MKKIFLDLPFYQFSGFEFPGLLHFISTRVGGFSQAPYHSLNIGLHVNDRPQDVLKNRELVCKKAGLNPQSLITMEQCHTANVEVIRADNNKKEFRNTDGLVTNVKNNILCAMSADCPLCLFYDPVQKVLAIAHSGWKGTLVNICAKILLSMDQLGCKRKNIFAGIGPCICGNCYEINQELWDKFGEKSCKKDREGRLTLDLAKTIELQLIEENLNPSMIETASICTSCRVDEFYSYRRENKITGRFGLFAVIL